METMNILKNRETGKFEVSSLVADIPRQRYPRSREKAIAQKPIFVFVFVPQMIAIRTATKNKITFVIMPSLPSMYLLCMYVFG